MLGRSRLHGRRARQSTLRTNLTTREAGSALDAERMSESSAHKRPLAGREPHASKRSVQETSGRQDSDSAQLPHKFNPHLLKTDTILALRYAYSWPE